MNPGLQALRSLPTIELVVLLGIPVFWIGCFIGFSFWCLIRGKVPRSPRFDKMGRARVVPRFLLEYGYFMLTWQMRLLMRAGMTADLMTIASLLLAGAGAYYLGIGRFCLGGWMMFMSFFCDAYDGLIARAQGTASVRGEYFDSVIDRYADLLVSFGFLWYYRNDWFAVVVVAAGMIGSTAMGYARAKGEAVGVDPNVGVMQRHERATWLGILTVTSPIFAAFIEPGAAHPRYHVALFALALIAVLSNVSAIWRAVYVMKRLPRPNAPIKVAAASPSPAIGNGAVGASRTSPMAAPLPALRSPHFGPNGQNGTVYP